MCLCVARACRHHLSSVHPYRVGVQSEPGCSSPFYLPTYSTQARHRLGIVSSYPSRGGIKVCSRPLWGLISAGYQGIIGGRAAKRQFTPRAAAAAPAAAAGPSNATTAAISALLPAHCLVVRSPPSCATLTRARCLSWRARRARSPKRRCEEGGRVRCEGYPPGYQRIL